MDSPLRRNRTLRILDLLVIIILAIFWYGLVPVAGAFVERRLWRNFRRRFDDLRLNPFLDYAAYRRGEGGSYRFIGNFESITDGRTLWIRSDELTIPVALAGAQTYVLPMPEKDASSGSFDPGAEAPQRIRWNQVTALTGEAKVFVGGLLQSQDDRLNFVSSKEQPLMVIFYDGPDRSLTGRAIRAGRRGNEYWNILTPYAYILGAFSQIMMAVFYLQRPAFRLTVITAFIAVFVPLFPMAPPGLILTLLYRQLWWRARVFRAYRDLARLPLKYLGGGRREGVLPDGEPYGGVYYETLPREFDERGIPRLIPEGLAGSSTGWFVFGALPAPGEAVVEAVPGGPPLPREPRDLFATYGAVPGNPEDLARRLTQKAYTLEIIAWVLLLVGISLNAFFIGMIIVFLG